MRARGSATGPAACLRSKTVHGTCTKCGAVPEVLHMPLRKHGWFCPGCCPACNHQTTEASAA